MCRDYCVPAPPPDRDHCRAASSDIDETTTATPRARSASTPRIEQKARCIRNTNEGLGLDDADAPSGAVTRHGLTELQMRTHPGLLIQKPCPQLCRGRFGVTHLPRQSPGGRQAMNPIRHLFKVRCITDPHCGIKFAVTTNVGETTRLVGIRPPVGTKTQIVARVASRRRRDLLGYVQNRFSQRGLRRRDDGRGTGIGRTPKEWIRAVSSEKP